MKIKPWRATCIQMPGQLAMPARNAGEAWEIIGRNVSKAAELIKLACSGKERPQLVVLPEFVFQGPPHSDDIPTWLAKACDTIPGRITAPLQDIARQQGIFVAGNLFERDPKWPERFFNSCFLISPDGEVIARFRRINTAMWPSPHDFMDAYLDEVGEDGAFPVVDTELGRLALVACGEIAVPEVARVFMMRGAEVILHPTNEAKSAGQEAAKIARAAENMVYVISANVAGGIGFSANGSVQGGRSHIIDFRGNSLAYEAGAAETTAVSAIIDVAALRRARNEPSMGNTIVRARWDMYRPYYASAVGYPANQFIEQPMHDAQATQPLIQAARKALVAKGVLIPASDID
jgi:predicted amidohydrolase